jgi:hypothetical protein
MATNEHNYGHVELQDDKVVWTINGQPMYQIPVSDIKIIGEFTTSDGPFLDDWFLTIITHDAWLEIPMHVNGMGQCITDLEKKLKTSLNYQLANSASWKTRIMFPDGAKDQELYDIIDIGSKTFWNRVKKIFGLQSSARKLSDKAQKILKS